MANENRGRWPLHTRMLIGVALGIAAGLVAHAWFAGDPRLAWSLTYVTQPIGKVFLRLLFMLVVPLIFSALVLGVTGLGDLRSLGRIGLKTLAYTVVVSTIAVLLGLVAGRTSCAPATGCPTETRARAARRAPPSARRSLAKAQAPKSAASTC